MRAGTAAVTASTALVGAGFDGASDVAVSPDGRRIAFVAHNGGSGDIMVMHRDGSGLRLVTSTPDNDDWPAWSADGRAIAFVRTGGESMGDLWLVDADGGNARALMRDR